MVSHGCRLARAQGAHHRPRRPFIPFSVIIGGGGGEGGGGGGEGEGEGGCDDGAGDDDNDDDDDEEEEEDNTFLVDCSPYLPEVGEAGEKVREKDGEGGDGEDGEGGGGGDGCDTDHVPVSFDALLALLERNLKVFFFLFVFFLYGLVLYMYT
jgi:hypothetical protein